MKKILNIIANGVSVVLMAIIVFYAVGNLELMEKTEEYYDFVMQVLYIVEIFIVMPVIIIAVVALIKGFRSNVRALQITLTVLLGVVCIYEFVTGSYAFACLCIAPIGLEIAAICVRIPEKKEVEEGKQEPRTIEVKIEEFKRLRDNGTISQQQYDEAVNDLLKNL